MFADAHFPRATIRVHPTGLEVWFPTVAMSWFGICVRPIWFKSLFVPWPELEITAKRGRFEYDGPVILRFEKTRNIGMRISGTVMDQLIELGAPYQVPEHGRIQQTEPPATVPS